MTTVLLLVDIQNDYFPGGRMELEGSVEAAREARRLLEFFRAEELPICHIQHVSVRPGATFFQPDTEGVRIHEGVHPREDEIVHHKHFPNAFRETSLLEHLREQGADRLVIAGMMTHMCVDATVRAAADLGFECLVASDACATRALSFGGVTVPARQVHAAFLAALDGTYAKVLDTESLLSLLLE
jgi:nicotinamidase-related amidase